MIKKNTEQFTGFIRTRVTSKTKKKKMKLIVIFVIFIECLSIASGDDTDYSNVNPDGSYAFG